MEGFEPSAVLATCQTYYLDTFLSSQYCISVISFLFSLYNIDSSLARCVCLSVLVIARGNFTALYYIEIIVYSMLYR